MNFFLKIKHWQLFLMMFAIPFVMQIVFMGTIFASIISQGDHLVTPDFSLFKYFPVIMIFPLGGLFGWMWSVATGLQASMPEQIKIKLNMFKIFFFIPLVYMLFFMGFMSIMFGSIATVSPDGPSAFFFMFTFILPVHFFAMLCIFYCIYTVAKIFKTAELQRPVTFSDFAGEFFMVWFLFVGIWILQPKINKIIEPGYQPPTYW